MYTYCGIRNALLLNTVKSISVYRTLRRRILHASMFFLYLLIYIYIYICIYVVVQRNPGNFLIQYCVGNNVGCILLRVVMLVLLLICRAVLLPSLLGKISLRATHRVTSCRCIRIAYVLGLKLLLSMYTYKKKEMH